jgi:hypothetical protein
MQHKISIIQGFYSGKMVGFYYSDWFQIRGEQEARSQKPKPEASRKPEAEARSRKWEVGSRHAVTSITPSLHHQCKRPFFNLESVFKKNPGLLNQG